MAGVLANAHQAHFSTSVVNETGGLRVRRPGWDEEVDKDASGNLIFQSLASLMQMKPNSRYGNGHSIARASIPARTLLYHGSFHSEYPSRDWIAFDPEHAFIFTGQSDGTLWTLTTTRELNFIYFDGCSANKHGAVLDTQDIFLWGHGEVGRKRGDWRVDEFARFNDGCEWAKLHGIDGFIRMEWDLYVSSVLRRDMT
ncbi:uncharacterized protein B0H18DRAFT_876027 [Fomitopsis serialis]|uniref:uncharacterized protein n=1 Tax=Fomitopsis serialis TaxID=139415 RepID=UPI002008AECF|nr:uncharacterized protein B0H18DRAFT_876027 [Neoantrodia serialis]KAH9926915.1 hypothetical protein B0H18DRAFT_876027 [Neoantrodia serialis]